MVGLGGAQARTGCEDGKGLESKAAAVDRILQTLRRLQGESVPRAARPARVPICARRVLGTVVTGMDRREREYEGRTGNVFGFCRERVVDLISFSFGATMDEQGNNLGARPRPSPPLCLLRRQRGSRRVCGTHVAGAGGCGDGHS